jgi:hypothetical protein
MKCNMKNIFKITTLAIALPAIFASTSALSADKIPASMQHKNKLFSASASSYKEVAKTTKSASKAAPKSIKVAQSHASESGLKLPASMRSKSKATAAKYAKNAHSDIIEDSTVIADEPEININVPEQVLEESSNDVVETKTVKTTAKNSGSKGFGKRNYNIKSGFVSKVLN